MSDVCVSFASLDVCDWCVVYMCSMIGEACFNNLTTLDFQWPSGKAGWQPGTVWRLPGESGTMAAVG